MKKNLPIVGDYIEIEYFQYEKTPALVVQVKKMWCSKNFLVTLYVPICEEYLYVESKKLTK